MLILTRRPGEVIYIGKDIKIIALGINGQQTKFGIEAPNDTKILREELIKRQLKEEDDNAQR